MLIPGLILLYLLFCCQLSQVEVKVQGVYEKLWFSESTASHPSSSYHCQGPSELSTQKRVYSVSLIG